MSYSKYKFQTLMTTYKLIWDNFCSWYLEIVKPKYGDPIDRKTYEKTIEYLEKILQILHPFMPFLSEEIWHLIKEQDNDIIISNWPKAKKIDNNILDEFRFLIEVIAGIRTIRKEQNIKNKDQLKLEFTNTQITNNKMNDIIIKLGNLVSMNSVSKPNSSFSFMVTMSEFFIPIYNTIDIENEIKKYKKN